MTSVLVVSDTHITPGKGLPLTLTNLVTDFDMVIHAGDISSIDALYEFRALRPTTAVYGNCDGWDLRAALPKTTVVTVEGARIGVVHGDGAGGTTQARARASFAPESVDIIVFGHSHIPLETTEDGVMMLNPGSILRPRTQPRPSYGVLLIDNGEVTMGIRYV